MSSSIQPHVLREYALVADGERGALIGPDGVIAWLCAPRWGSPAAFSGLLGGPGRYADPWNVWGGYYETGSLIWRSRWGGGSAHTRSSANTAGRRGSPWPGRLTCGLPGLWRCGE